jgi:hypothetical protein
VKPMKPAPPVISSFILVPCSGISDCRWQRCRTSFFVNLVVCAVIVVS